MPSLFEIKAAGRAKAKAAREALAKEEALAGGAGALWASAFDYVYDSAAADPAAAQAFASLPEDARILVVVPGFSSWSALTAQHVDAWVSSALTVNPASSSAPPAKTVAFKWDCGDVRWAGEDVWTEAAAAWQGAHESAAAAAQALATLCATLRAAPNRRVVVAAHSLGARVALGACVIDRGAQPLIDGLVLLGAAVDDCAIGSDADAEFQLTPLLANCSALTLVHSSRDPTLTKLWAAGEYARCGRIAPPALGAAGLARSGASESPIGPDVVARIDASEILSEHDPTAYIALPPVAAALRAALFSAR